jgi:N-acetyl-gamma-glutamyl-phosphate reductase
MIRIGILGGAGYTAGELIRLLINHPQAEIVFVNSESNAGNLLTDVHEGLYGDTDMRFTSDMPFNQVDVLFFCFGHGKSEAFLKDHDVPSNVKIIDLAQDFRLAPTDGGETQTRYEPEGVAHPTPKYHDYVYGLPELNRAAIANAKHIANPGCFATCIQLGLLPAAKQRLLSGNISVNAITGSTGAGVKPGATTHFSWRNNNLSIYKAFRHQHVPEIRQSLRQEQGYLDASIDFIPYRGDFARGIFATEVVQLPDVDEQAVVDGYRQYYANEPFTHYVENPLDLKQVVNTNKALIHVDIIDHKLLVTSCIDNLLKGAVGQAVQNMNIMFGIDETTGLRLKPSAF